MTGFRLAQNLHAYSGGTVRDLHPVFYSPTGLLPPPQALEQYIHYLYRIASLEVFVNGLIVPMMIAHFSNRFLGFRRLDLGGGSGMIGLMHLPCSSKVGFGQ